MMDLHFLNGKRNNRLFRCCRKWHTPSFMSIFQPIVMIVIGIAIVAAQPQRNLANDIKTLAGSIRKQFLPIAEALFYNDDLSEECTTALLRTGRALQTGKIWAAKMLLSSGLVPDNFFLGQTQAHGSLEQCLWTNIIQDENSDERQESHYCKVRVAFESNNSFYNALTNEIYHTSGVNVQAVPEIIKGIYTGLTISLCLPRDCAQADLQITVDTLTSMYGGWAEVSSCQNSDPIPIQPQHIVIIVVLCFIACLSFVGTFIDSSQSTFRKTYPGRIIRCFSLFTAWSTLLSSEGSTGRTGYLNGLKLMLCLWIASGHLIIFPSPEYTRNPGEFFSIVSRSLWFQIFSNINLAVVGFFFISGYLVHVNTMRFSGDRKWRFVAVSFIRRYVKLLVPALLVLLTTFLFPLLIRTASPREGFYSNNIGACPSEWYLLPCLSNNYIDIYHEQCLTHLWYIATDLKIYPFIVALSIFYRREARRGVIVSVALVLITSLVVSLETFFGGAAGVVARANLERERYMATGKALDLYTKPHTQIAAYLMGMLCAALVEKFGDEPPKLTMFAKYLMWTVAVGLFVVQTLFITFSSIQVFSPAGIWMSLYAGISRPLHAIVYAWIISACSLYFAEPVRRFLSHPALFVLGKLSYGVYLIHFPLGSFGYAHLKSPTLQYDLFSLSQSVLGLLAQSFLLAAILFLFVEKPLANIDRLLSNRQNHSHKDSTNNAERMSKDGSLPSVIQCESNGAPNVFTSCADNSGLKPTGRQHRSPNSRLSTTSGSSLGAAQPKQAQTATVYAEVLNIAAHGGNLRCPSASSKL